MTTAKKKAPLYQGNESRADHARKALKAYPGRDEHDLEASITDLICDLLHLAKAEGIDEEVVDRAVEHYVVESGCKGCDAKSQDPADHICL